VIRLMSERLARILGKIVGSRKRKQREGSVRFREGEGVVRSQRLAFLRQ